MVKIEQALIVAQIDKLVPDIIFVNFFYFVLGQVEIVLDLFFGNYLQSGRSVERFVDQQIKRELLDVQDLVVSHSDHCFFTSLDLGQEVVWVKEVLVFFLRKLKVCHDEQET